MKYTEFRACFYPTTTVFLDDNITFLNSISLKLKNDCQIQLFDDPHLALRHIQSSGSITEFSEAIKYDIDCAELDIEETDKNEIISVDLGRIGEQIYDTRRFNRVSTIFVDYKMPIVNGVEFFEKIRDIPLRKILITAEAGHQIAVEAFNRGIIDKFIFKDTDLVKNINQIIIEGQTTYFNDFSNFALWLLRSEQRAILNNPSLLTAIAQWLNKNKAVEYYMFNKKGSMVCFDKTGDYKILLIITETDFINYHNLCAENGAPDDVLKKIERREEVPCFPKKLYNDFSTINWQSVLKKAEKLNNSEPIYLVYKSEKDDFDRDKIFSYEHFMTQSQ